MKTNQNLPKHIAIVMDGNGRWAKARFMPRFMGHKKGVKSLREVVKACALMDIECLSLFAFSSENWKRPKEEVKSLMSLFMISLDREAKAMARNNVRLQIIGDLSLFSEKLQNKIKQVETLTEKNDGLRLVIAANYGGRWDIAQSVRQLANKVELGELDSSSLSENDISGSIMTSGLPDPDLFIRTGGEKRISNFLLWQMAYTELYFTDTLWPDFGKAELNKALDDYSSRQRRFGKTGEQVVADKK